MFLPTATVVGIGPYMQLMGHSIFYGPLFDVFHKYSLIQSSQQPYKGEETEIQAQAQVQVK